jgi:hypothetical protein
MSAVKLTIEQAMEIRRTYERKGYGSAGARVLAGRYGVSVAVVYRILSGEHPLVKGAPNISARRGSITMNPTRAAGRDLAAPPKPFGTRVPGELSRAQAIARPCPVCNAKPRESCVNPRATYPYPMKTVHPERRTPGGDSADGE